MLLRALTEFAQNRRLLDDLAFALKSIRWLIPLTADGQLIGAGPIEVGEKNRGREYSCPRTARPKDAGGVAEFLVDGLTAVFGVEAEPDRQQTEKQRRDRDANNQRKFDDFWQQLNRAAATTHDVRLDALVAFHQQVGQSPPFLRWGVSTEADPGEKPRWWIRTASGTETRLGPDNFTFQVEGELLVLDEQSLRPYWRNIYHQEVAEKEATAETGLCLVTGEVGVTIAPTHSPKIKGVPNTQSFGAAIVSFDKDAFTSYGFDQSYNAPVSTTAVAAYCTALNWLLSRNDHSVRLGGTKLCFWAHQSETSFFAQMLEQPDPQTVAEFVKSPWAGIDRHLARQDRFYSVTLAGNAGRVVIRHWMQTSLETACENLRNWFVDLDMVALSQPRTENSRRKKTDDSTTEPTTDKAGIAPLALFRLACSTVREAKELQTEVLSQLYGAALEGTAPSLALLKPIVYRFQVDLAREGTAVLRNISRFALLRLILNRNRKENDPMLEPQLIETDDPAYNCGRLLALFDDLQLAAHDYKLEGAGVVERYYGTASSAPNSAFGILWRLHQHHLKKISRQGDKGKARAEAIKRRIAEIASLFRPLHPGLPPEFPRTFGLQEQGRFALGFYQQKAADDAARRAHSLHHQPSEPPA